MLCAVKNFGSITSSGKEVSDAFMVPGIPLGAPAETDGYFDLGGKLAPQRVTGLIWLTSYKLGEAAHNPHLLQRSDGNILILWEKSGPDGSVLWAMTVHESGRVLMEAQQLGLNLQLDREEPPLRLGNRTYFIAQEKATGRALLCFMKDDLEVKK